MRRTSMSRSSTPMKRTPMNRSRAPIKRSGKRKQQIDGHHEPQYTDACRGESCYVAVDGVCLGPAGKDTVVAAHSNQLAHGKGFGLKAKDRYSVPACHACHAWMDQNSTGASRTDKFDVFNRALERWKPARRLKMQKETQ